MDGAGLWTGMDNRRAPANAVDRHGFLTVRGSQLVDRRGKPVTLRGMSLFWSQWQPRYFCFETLQWLKEDWGVDIVRAPLGVHHGGYLENPAIERRKLEAVLQAAIALGLYLVVDWHAHSAEPLQAGRFFCEIARDYGSFPNIIYETWNEPSADHDWETIRSYHLSVLEQIRRWDCKNLVVAGTQNWCRDVDVAANHPLPGPNIAYALHFYAASHGQALRDKAERALRMGAALMATEWGTCREDGDGPVDIGETGLWLRFLEKHRISHINWSVGDRPESSAVLAPGTQATSHWSKRDITVSGHLIRKHLRRQRAGHAHHK